MIEPKPNRPGGPLEDSRSFFEVEDIVIAPTAVRTEEKLADGGVDFTPAHQRGVIGGIRQAMQVYEQDHEKGNEVIQEIAEKAIKFGIFEREELKAVLRNAGVGVLNKEDIESDN